MKEQKTFNTLEEINEELERRKEEAKKDGKYKTKKGLKIGAVALTGVTAATALVACNANEQTSLPAPSQTPEQKIIPEIPVAYQTNRYSYAMDYPADFFSSKANHMQINPDSGRYVDLNNYLTSYIYYEDGLDSEIVEEIKRAASYLESVLHTINHGYSIEVKKGSAKLISQLFCKDSIFFCKANADKIKEMEKSSAGATAMTTKSPMTPPKIYINKNKANEIIVNGKRISLNKVILHEMLHGYGFIHTLGQLDVMYYTIGHTSKDSRGKWMIEAKGKKSYITDYFKFTDDEVRSLIYKFCHAKDNLNITVPMYKQIMGIETISQYDFKDYVDNYIKQNRKILDKYNPGKEIKPDQIISMDSTDRNLRVVLNADYLGMYKAFYKGRVFKGEYFLYNTTVNGKTYQTIYLNNFQYSANDKGSLKIVPNRKEISGDRFQYFQTVNSKERFTFIDSTEKWFTKNNIIAEKVDIASLLGVEFPVATTSSKKSKNGREM